MEIVTGKQTSFDFLHGNWGADTRHRTKHLWSSKILRLAWPQPPYRRERTASQRLFRARTLCQCVVHFGLWLCGEALPAASQLCRIEAECVLTGRQILLVRRKQACSTLPGVQPLPLRGLHEWLMKLSRYHALQNIKDITATAHVQKHTHQWLDLKCLACYTPRWHLFYWHCQTSKTIMMCCPMQLASICSVSRVLCLVLRQNLKDYESHGGNS